jgi:DNA-binding FrmR family transcriptional regulator
LKGEGGNRFGGAGGRRAVLVGYAMNKEQVLKRLRRIEGQVRGIIRMVEQDTYCIDVLTQVNAARAALEGAALGLLDDHVRHCVRDSVRRDGGEDKVQELMAAVGRMVKS